ncbi:hypothetical protein NUACC21_48820 [Scytonema sp. NUACC21]
MPMYGVTVGTKLQAISRITKTFSIRLNVIYYTLKNVIQYLSIVFFKERFAKSECLLQLNLFLVNYFNFPLHSEYKTDMVDRN